MLAALCLALLGASEVHDIGRDAQLYATAPLRWNAADWGTAAAVTAATGALFLADAPLHDWIHTHRCASWEPAAAAVRQSGEGRITVPVLGLLWGLGEIDGHPELARTGREGIESFAFSGTAALLLKYGLGRHRPPGSSTDWNASRRNAGGLSFPSGHSEAAWSVLTVIALEGRNIPGAAPLAFGLAGACSLSRLYNERHWSSDVFFGSALGFASGWAVVHWNRPVSPADSASIPVSVSLSVSSLNFSFPF